MTYAAFDTEKYPGYTTDELRTLADCGLDAGCPPAAVEAVKSEISRRESVQRIEYYKAYLKAARIAECLLTAYAKEDPVSAEFYRDDAVGEFRKLAGLLGFELVPTSSEKEVA